MVSIKVIIRQCIYSVLFLSSSLLFSEGAPTTPPQILWEENYDEAIQRAHQLEKPVLLYFSGSDWCRWCKKIKSEVFESEEFEEYLRDFFVYINIDFPKEKKQDLELIQQNTKLKNRYKIRSFPTVIIMDHNEQEIDRLGYLKGGGKAYREKVFQVLKNFEIYKESIDKLNKGLSSQLDLESLYKTAKKLNSTEDVAKILNEGLKQNSLFFLVEKYQALAEAGKRKTQKALSVKEKVLDSDPEDHEGWHYRLAVIDFQSNLKSASDEQNILSTLKPLTDYLSRFGNTNNKNTWKIQITVAQTLLSHNRNKEALSYAKQSLRFAPKNRKSEILQAVRYIQNLIAGIEPHGEILGNTIR